VQFNYDEWENPRRVRDAFERLSRAAERGPAKEELTRSYELPAKAMTANEFAEFKRKGRKIDYGEERLEKQCLNDLRHEERVKRHPLIDVVIDVVAAWNSAGYLGRHRAIVREILAKPRNQRRRKLSGMSTKERRHQEAIRLVPALAFDGMTQAEYCRRHNLAPSDASRMLAHLDEKEPGLVDAMGAISACATAISWQNRQQQKLLRHKREGGIRIKYGYDYRDVADNGWLSDVPSSRFRSVSSGRFKPIEPLARLDLLRPETRRKPSKPFNLHRPGKWRRPWAWTHWEREPVNFWDALYEPIRTVERYDVPLRYGVYDRYRDLSRNLTFKDGKQMTRSIARAIPIWDWDTRPLGYHPQYWYPVPNVWGVWNPTRARYEAVAVVGGYVPARVTKASQTVRVRRIEECPRPMCTPIRCVPLPPSPPGPHRFIQPYTRRDWISWPVKQYEVLLPKQFEGGTRLYFVRSVTADPALTPTTTGDPNE
jgi:hypothetical protein